MSCLFDFINDLGEHERDENGVKKNYFENKDRQLQNLFPWRLTIKLRCLAEDQTIDYKFGRRSSSRQKDIRNVNCIMVFNN